MEKADRPEFPCVQGGEWGLEGRYVRFPVFFPNAKIIQGGVDGDGKGSPGNVRSLMVDHVLKLHGIPAEITSDKGPQFTSQVWRSFCSALGAQVNLSSGYHPQKERSNREAELGPGVHSSLRHQSQPGYLVFPSTLGGVCSQWPRFSINRFLCF